MKRRVGGLSSWKVFFIREPRQVKRGKRQPLKQDLEHFAG